MNPIALVRSDGKTIMEDGTILKHPGLAPKDTSLYAMRPLTTEERTEIRWMSDLVTTRHHQGNRYIRHLHSFFSDTAIKPTDVEVLEGLVQWRDWVGSYGVNVKQSFSSVATGLWVRTSGSNHPIPEIPDWENAGLDMPLGGRTHRPEKFYYEAGETWLWDMAGAYAWAVANALYPEAWELVEDDWSGDPLAFVHCKVWIPPIRQQDEGTLRAPDPVANLKYWGPRNALSLRKKIGEHIEAQLFVPGFELHTLSEEIVVSRVLRSWEPRGSLLKLTRPGWQDAIEDGRALPNPVARRLAKRTGNALWGSFAARGKQKLVNYSTGEYWQSGELPARSMGLAGIITGMVRVREWQEALTTMPVISAHTDSAFAPGGYSPTGPIGDNLGDWKLKQRMFDLLVFSPTVRRYRLTSGGPLIYVVGSKREREAEERFGYFLRRYIDATLSDPPIWDRHSRRHRPR